MHLTRAWDASEYTNWHSACFWKVDNLRWAPVNAGVSIDVLESKPNPSKKLTTMFYAVHSNAMSVTKNHALQLLLQTRFV